MNELEFKQHITEMVNHIHKISSLERILNLILYLITKE